MTTTININGTLTLDQTSGIQPDDTAISNDLTGLSTAFKDFLNGLSGDLQLSAGQLAFADNVEAAVSGAGLVTVNPDGATISKLFFSDGSGAPLDGDQVIFNSSPLLTVDGSQPIFLHSYANGTIVLATTSAAEGVGDVVAAFYLNAAGDNLTASVEMVTFQAIAHPDSTNPDDTIDWTNLLNVSATGSTSFNFDNLASGNNLFVAVGTSGAGLVVSGIHPVIQADGTLDNSGDNIKTSQGGIGATIGVNNQMFDPGETAVFSFVKGQAPGTYGDIDNMSYTDFIDVTDAKLFISQTEGSPGTNFTVKIGAFSAGGASTNPEAGRSYIDNNLNSGANLGNDAGQSALADDSSVAIVRVIIRDGNGVVVTDTTATNGFVTFNGDGTITAQHLNDAYTVQWFTDNSGTQAVETFNRFQATAVVGKFDVGRVDLSQGVTVTQSVGDKLHTNDDGPTAGLTENTAKVLHDETAGVDASSNDQTLISLPAAFAALGTAIGWAASASAVVTPNSTFGTDGPGTQTLSLGVSGANADSGFDSLDHHNILLNVEGGGLVVGRVDVGNDGNTTGDPIAIAISINASGILSIAQYIAIAHPDGNNPDDVTTMLDSALLAKVTVTDGDGDSNSTSIAIGDKVQIRDDGPTAGLTENGAGVLHDETSGVDASSNDQTLISLPAAFAALGTAIGWAASASAVVTPNSTFGIDGPGTQTLSLGVSGANADSGFDSLDHHNILLNVEGGGLVVGRVDVGNDGNTTGDPIAIAISINASGILSIAQYIAIAHPDGTNPDDVTTMLDSALLAKVTVTDGDGDSNSTSIAIGDKVQIRDDGPTAGLTENTAKVLHDETAGVDASSNDQTLISLPAAFAALGTAIGWAASASAVVTPNSTFGTDGPGTQTLSLGVSGANADSGFDSLDHHNILLNVEGGGLVVGRVDVGNDGNTTGDPIAIAISINASGILSIAQYIAIAHPDGTNPDDVTTMLDSALLAKLHTVDGDGDTSDTSIAIGDKVQIRDDGPTITHPFDGDPDTAGIQNETLANTAGATASGTFGYNIGADAHPTAFYTGGGSDFSPITLTGTVSGVNPAPTALLTSDVTLASETLTSATFNFTFTYDKDPAAGPQTGTAGGTLVFDKVAHTYTINLTDPLEGFSFDIIHTSQFLSKVPTSNTGHPPIVLEKLQADDPNTLNVNENFYVQFTGNLVNKANPFGLTSNGEGSSTDTSFNTPTGTHDMISNANETWVSATQSTNGVAGDTIQKGELLTLRFFNSDVGIQNEATAPTATASAMAIKFDGIGNSEDLMLILDLLDKGADNIAGTADDGPAITRAMYVENTDIFRIGQVPAPYNSEFTLDNNDGLVVIEQNDYNAASEHYALQGVQIMQSGNGITGNAINLNTTGSNGGASSTTTLVSFDGSDNDVLKITDIGFTSTVTTTPDANLDFAFQVADADADQTAIQHILVDVV
ncbi:DUF5801 repeats-in-toxin domain-containing protein [Mesorhizobium sp. dw_380]|uniref:beta strand repeat-containing protein n=1 Tax=Mesorhizobium sp. dw_380 TaxID=2812001 RepID=UPI001BDEE834|nr:DUF5801 repeats-in-toxin domain-containing protein [Mesorhizobium sp. dw_380]